MQKISELREQQNKYTHCKTKKDTHMTQKTKNKKSSKQTTHTQHDKKTTSTRTQRSFLVYRVGSNTHSHEGPLCRVFCNSSQEARELAESVHTFYANQYSKAVAWSKANKEDRLEIMESANRLPWFVMANPLSFTTADVEYLKESLSTHTNEPSNVVQNNAIVIGDVLIQHTYNQIGPLKGWELQEDRDIAHDQFFQQQERNIAEKEWNSL